MIRDDYLIRMIRRAAEAVTRALGVEQADDAATEAALTEALGDIVRLPVATLVMLDQDSLAPLVGGGDDGASRVLAQILTALAAIDERRGNRDSAKQKRACAIGIYTRVGVGDEPADRAAAKTLTSRR